MKQVNIRQLMLQCDRCSGWVYCEAIETISTGDWGGFPEKQRCCPNCAEDWARWEYSREPEMNSDR